VKQTRCLPHIEFRIILFTSPAPYFSRNLSVTDFTLWLPLSFAYQTNFASPTVRHSDAAFVGFKLGTYPQEHVIYSFRGLWFRAELLPATAASR
jgi:hypothetical protein